jgi:hypothetical protein
VITAEEFVLAREALLALAARYAPEPACRPIVTQVGFIFFCCLCLFLLLFLFLFFYLFVRTTPVTQVALVVYFCLLFIFV